MTMMAWKAPRRLNDVRSPFGTSGVNQMDDLTIARAGHVCGACSLDRRRLDGHVGYLAGAYPQTGSRLAGPRLVAALLHRRPLCTTCPHVHDCGGSERGLDRASVGAVGSLYRRPVLVAPHHGGGIGRVHGVAVRGGAALPAPLVPRAHHARSK